MYWILLAAASFNIIFVFNILRHISVQILELEEEFFDLAERFKLQILYFTIQKLFCKHLLLILLFWSVLVVCNPSSVCESIVHSQFYLQLSLD